jgi:protein subunit release factor A
MKSFREIFENNKLVKLLKQYNKIETNIEKLKFNTSSIKDFGSERRDITMKDSALSKIKKKQESLRKIVRDIEKISNFMSEKEWDDILTSANMDVEEYNYNIFKG